MRTYPRPRSGAWHYGKVSQRPANRTLHGRWRAPSCWLMARSPSWLRVAVPSVDAVTYAIVRTIIEELRPNP
jgi:hypothetical protein